MQTYSSFSIVLPKPGFGFTTFSISSLILLLRNYNLKYQKLSLLSPSFCCYNTKSMYDPSELYSPRHHPAFAVSDAKFGSSMLAASDISLSADETIANRGSQIFSPPADYYPRGYISYEFHFSRGDMYNLAYIGAKKLNF